MANSVDLNVLDIPNTILANEFSLVIEKLVSIDRFIINSLFETIRNNPKKRFIVDELVNALREHYTLKHSIWIFIQSIGDYLNNSLTAGLRKSRNSFLYEFCESFDYEIIRPLLNNRRKMGSQIYYLLNDNSREDKYRLRRDYEFVFDELYELISLLPKKTIRVIEDSINEDRRLGRF